ncbi:MAG: carbamoyl-phosphate synthase large subunit, partial [Lentisphaeria bacterium]|nr:carbamoyl-phosphate synthase large subunit [Lentisphaeria bacterium]
MVKIGSYVDELYIIAEEMASDFTLFPDIKGFSYSSHLDGLLTDKQIDREVRALSKLNVDDYVERTVFPSEEKNRPGVKAILDVLPITIISEVDDGPLYSCEVEIPFELGKIRRIAFIAQNRETSNGVWLPEHHQKAAQLARKYADFGIPIVTLIDTPGADAGELANMANQAHSISKLIAEFAQIDIPTLGIIIGNGYSGGAIPLATTNILLSLKDGVFNTIQPRGLASIARKYDLSWQECAKYVGVSSYELCKQGYIDGIINYTPDDNLKVDNLYLAIVTGIKAIEDAACKFAAQNNYIFEHYQRSIHRYLSPSANLNKLQDKSDLSLSQSPTNVANVFGLTYRYMRYLGIRKRISFTTIERYGRLTDVEFPKGDLSERTAKEHKETFELWISNAMDVKYDDVLRRSWIKYIDKLGAIGIGKRSRVGQFFLGDPKTEYGKALRQLSLEFGFTLYNLWKDSAQNNLLSLIGHLLDDSNEAPEDLSNPTILDVVMQDEIRYRFAQECQNLLLFDLIYNNIIANLKDIAVEAKNDNIVSKRSIKQLLESSLEAAVQELTKKQPDNEIIITDTAELMEQFQEWLRFFVKQPKRQRILKATEQWKKIAFPRVSEPLFAIITYLFEHLIPSYLASERGKTNYDSKIDLRDIGIKDFWNRLNIAYHDLLIHDTLLTLKKKRLTTTSAIIDKFFVDFEELNGSLMSCDPVHFPGFRISIEQALKNGIAPCGTITGIATYKKGKSTHEVGLLVSNLDFQAGAFDMASGEKFCKLLVECAKHRLPVICFISSGGMQTKEGAGALYSMAIVNDRITRFIRDNDLPIIIFGFGDCTGGAQASMVTHPMVQTYYFSGTNMPFAGQIVVPSYLPNYS